MSGKGPVLPVRELWGTIRSGAAQRATTAEIWDAIRAVAAERGRALPRGAFKEVNQMRSLASGLRNAADRLERANPDQVITGDMIGLNIYSRSMDQMSLAPRYHIRYEVNSIVDGELVTTWLSDVRSNLTGVTVGELQDDLNASAIVSAASGSPVAGDITSIGRIEISMV